MTVFTASWRVGVSHWFSFWRSIPKSATTSFLGWSSTCGFEKQTTQSQSSSEVPSSASLKACSQSTSKTITSSSNSTSAPSTAFHSLCSLISPPELSTRPARSTLVTYTTTSPKSQNLFSLTLWKNLSTEVMSVWLSMMNSWPSWWLKHV